MHRDGITLSLGNRVLFHAALPHVLVLLLGVAAFFTKVLVVCWIQVFVRWSLPRFRYDQLMSLCWKYLLPLSLANVLLTGGLYLLLACLGKQEVSSALRALSDSSQAAVVLLIASGWVMGIVGLCKPRPSRQWVVGSSAQRAARLGRSPQAPMQP